VDGKLAYLASSALVLFSAALLALNGGITININRYEFGGSNLADGLITASESINSAGEEQFFTSSPSDDSSSDFVYDPTIPYDAVYGQPGEFDIAQELNTVTLSSGGATLKNKTINRNVLITAEDGLVIIEDCTVSGAIKVTGGANVLLRGVSAARVAVDAGNGVSVSLDGSEIDICDVYTHCTLSGNGFSRVRTQSGAGLVTIKLKLENMALSELTVVESVTVSLHDASIEKTTGSENIYYE